MNRQAGSQASLDAAIAANDTKLASLESVLANVEAAVAVKGRNAAALAKAQLDLDYTTVRSPINGRISQTDIKVGNLVENGTQLATVIDQSKVVVNFSISDPDMLEFMANRRAKMGSGTRYEDPFWSEIPVYLRRESDEGFPFAGELNYVGQAGVDADTGTLGMRSIHDNADSQLVPGLFVTVRIPSGDMSDAMLIPEYAVLRDQRGRFVLAVDDDRNVQRLSVTVAKAISGWAVITDGLNADAKVVVEGLQRARPGLEVQPIDKPISVNDTEILRGLSPSQLPAGSASDIASAPEDDVVEPEDANTPASE